MYNMIGYLQEHGDETFAEHSFCATDALILSQMSYVNWDGIVGSEKIPGKGCRIKDILSMHKENQIVKGSLYGPQNLCMVSACAMTKRFRDVKMFAYVSNSKKKIHLQFSAVSFQLPDGLICVVFRGTDETVNGWQENFSMFYRFPVPAQESSVKYLEDIIDENPKAAFVVSGHSKGGNLAVYSSAKCREQSQERIKRVYNFDGPGFWSEFLQETGYKKIAGKVRKYVVPESLIGLMFENDGETYMVESAGHGMMQHDPFQWKVDEFRLKKAMDYDNEKRKQGEALNSRMLNLPKEDARKLIEAFFGTLNKRGVRNITQIKAEDTLAVIRGLAEEKCYNREAVTILGTLVIYFVPSKTKKR